MKLVMGETRYILSVTIFMINNDIIAMKSSDEHITRLFSTQALTRLITFSIDLLSSQI